MDETTAMPPDAIPPEPARLMELTAEVVAAYVRHNAVTSERLPSLIGEVHAAFLRLGQPEATKAEVGPLVPAVPIRKSVTDDYIVSLEDGRRLKSLKRYLKTAHNMTPAEYRAKWGLPADYPMVAPAYARQRSELAKSMGLGSNTKAKPSAAAA